MDLRPQQLRVMGFKPSKADFDLWMRPKDDHCECMATCVDDIVVFSKDCMSIIERIKEAFDLKQVGVPEHYLGGNFHTISEREAPNTLETRNDNPQHHLLPKWEKEGVHMASSAKTYMENLIERLEQTSGHEFAKHNSPMHDALHPEVDDSPFLDAKAHSQFRSLIGCANCIITLGRFDIAYSINSLSRFSQAPREGHLDALKRVFGRLKKQFDVQSHEQWKEFHLMQKRCF